MTNLSLKMRIAGRAAMMMVASAGLMIATGCSSENDLNQNEPVQEQTLDMGTYSVFASNNGRVHNYGSSSTRAGGDYETAAESFVMPVCPSIPADALDLNYADEWGNKPNLNYGTPAVGGSYYLKAGETLNTGLKAEGITIYVAGKLELTSLNSGDKDTKGCTFYVLPTGEIKFGDWVALTENVIIYNYGKLSSTTGITIGEDSKIYSEVDINCVGEFGVNAANPNNGKPAGELYCKGSINATKVRLNGKAIACAFIAEDEITLNDNGTMKTSYFEANNMTLNAANVVMDHNGLIKVGNVLAVSNADTRFTVNGTNAVVAAANFTTNNKDWPKNTFSDAFCYDITKCYIGGNECGLNDFGLQVSDSGAVVYVPATGCHGEYLPTGAQRPAVDEEEIIIKKIADIDPIEDEEGVKQSHEHGTISATCINFASDGKAYASYHLRGDGTDPDVNANHNPLAQKGCIEEITIDGDGAKLTSYMIAPDYDFNHIIVDGNDIITVGNHATKGAFIGALPLGFAASQTVRSDFEVKALSTGDKVTKNGVEVEENAGDGNCVIRQGDVYYVNTYRGYGAVRATTEEYENSHHIKLPRFSRISEQIETVNGKDVTVAKSYYPFHKTNGSSKHIATNGTDMALISLDTYDKTSSTASVEVYALNDEDFASKKSTYSAIGTVSPVDGKNVIAMDGETIYACLSEGGFVRVNDGETYKYKGIGNNKTSWIGTDKEVAVNGLPVNGMAFDEQYIYLATGSHVVVLDKQTLKEVCHYHAESGKSANYIALRNGKIYVAFGEDGIKIFELGKKEHAEVDNTVE